MARLTTTPARMSIFTTLTSQALTIVTGGRGAWNNVGSSSSQLILDGRQAAQRTSFPLSEISVSGFEEISTLLIRLRTLSQA